MRNRVKRGRGVVLNGRVGGWCRGTGGVVVSGGFVMEGWCKGNVWCGGVVREEVGVHTCRAPY